jgi:hypothetical protein
LAGSEAADGFAGTFGFGISSRRWISCCHCSGLRISPSWFRFPLVEEVSLKYEKNRRSCDGFVSRGDWI